MNKDREAVRFIELMAASLITAFVVFLLGPLLTPTIFVNHENAPAAIDIASTFIAYIALIIGMATIILTVLGIWFTYWFSAEKAEILKETTKSLAHQIAVDSVQRETFFKHIIELLNENDLRQVKSDFLEQLEAISEEKRKEYAESLPKQATRGKRGRPAQKPSLDSMLEE